MKKQAEGIGPLPPRAPQRLLNFYILPGLRLLLIIAAYFYLYPLLLHTAAGIIAAQLPQMEAPPWLRWAGFLAGLGGAYLFLRAWLILASMGKEWPRRPTRLLVRSHIYRLVRHPLYLGYGAALIGWGLWRSSAALVLLSLTTLGALFAYAGLVEEPALSKRFGREYLAYRARVRFFRPRWRELGRGALELNLFLLVTLIVFRWLFRILWRIEVEGQEHVPKEGGFLLVMNHVNLADPFLVGLFLTRRVCFMASDELFRKPLFKLLFSKLWPAFPKRRWGRDIGALRNAQRMLARDEAVGIFPEGARNWDGGPVSVGDEVYRFIHHCRVPVLCATIIGGHEAMPRWASWPSFTRVTIRFFPVIQPDNIKSFGDLRAAIEPRIFACALEPPRPRRFWKSHRGLPTVVWGCLQCGTLRCVVPTADGLRCRSCGAEWLVTPTLHMVNTATGQALLVRDYHARLKARLAAGDMRGGSMVWAQAKGFRVVDGRLAGLGRGELVIARDYLSYDNGQDIFRLAVPEIIFAFLNLRNRLVVSDGVQALELQILNESPVLMEDFLGMARGKPMKLWRPQETAKSMP